MTTHITYKTAKRLKEFLGKDAPEPMMEQYYWVYDDGEDTGPLDKEDVCTKYGKMPKPEAHSYQLHDILSKPFCEAMAKNTPRWKPDNIGYSLFTAYFMGGLPQTEKALCEMMEGK